MADGVIFYFVLPVLLLAKSFKYEPVAAGNSTSRLIDWDVPHEKAERVKTPRLVFFSFLCNFHKSW